MGTERTNEIDAAASDWLIRRDSGAWTDADQARFDQWLNASTLNRVAFLRLELAWEDAARLKALGAGIRGDQPPPPGHCNFTPFFDSHLPDPPAAFEAGTQGIEPPPAPVGEREEYAEVLDEEARGSAEAETLKQRWRFFAVAATLLIAVGAGVYVARTPHGDRYATPVGGFASVPMADGSKVTLNTDSQIRIALSDTERRVELTKGEAFFEVSKDPARPFIVRAGTKRVIAVGTQFSVRREGDDIEVVVTEGKVRVEDGGAGQSYRANGSADVFLTPGSVARAGEAGVLVQRKTLPEAEEQLSWRTGVLMFRDESLQEAIVEFNRYNVRKIVIQDPQIAALKIEGNFRATNVEAFVRLLENGFPVRAQAELDQIVLTAK
jgi:transmembrane sensor